MAAVSRKKKGGKNAQKGGGKARPKFRLRSTRQSGRQSAPKGEVELLKPSEDDILKLLAAKVHIGHEKAHVNMKRYIWKKRADGVNIINLEKTWHKLVLAARIIVTVASPQDVMVMSTRKFGQRAAIKFAHHTQATPCVGAWVNGSLTNPENKSYMEPRLIIVDDPRSTFPALVETSYVGIPVIGFCGVDNNTRFVDCAIPCNNRGKYSIGLLFWLLAREVLRIRGMIPRTLFWEVSVDLFFYRDPEEIEKQQQKMLEDQRPDDEEDYTGVDDVDDGGAGVLQPVGGAYPVDQYAAQESEDWLEAPPEVGLQGWNEDVGYDQQYFGGGYYPEEQQGGGGGGGGYPQQPQQQQQQQPDDNLPAW